MPASPPDGETIVFSAAVTGNTTDTFTERKQFPDPRPLGFPNGHLLSVSSRGELAILTHSRYIGFRRLFDGTLARVLLDFGLAKVQTPLGARSGSGVASMPTQLTAE
jgi:hypothetical protein